MKQLPPNLTQPARYVLEMAREITSSGASTRPEHILYALLQIPGSDVPKILESLAVDSNQLLTSLRASLRALPLDPAPSEWSTTAEQVIAHASTEAFQQRGREISTANLFTALLAVDNPVRSLLFDRGISLEKISAAVAKQTSSKPTSAPTTAQGSSNKVSDTKGRAIQVSGVFWGLLAATIICGYLAWTPSIPNKPFAVFLFVTLGWIVSLCLHEFGHAITAYYFGDDSVYYRGYLTLNPLRYTDPFVSIVLPLIFLMMGGLGLPGGAVFIDRSRIKDGWRHSLISMAGPLANGLVVVVLWAALVLVPAEVRYTHAEFWAGISFLLFLELTAIFFNLIPLPPLDGFNILAPYLPESMQGLVNVLRQWGFFLLMMLFWVDNPIIGQFWDAVIRVMLSMNIDVMAVFQGLDLYRFWAYGG